MFPTQRMLDLSQIYPLIKVAKNSMRKLPFLCNKLYAFFAKMKKYEQQSKDEIDIFLTIFGTICRHVFPQYLGFILSIFKLFSPF